MATIMSSHVYCAVDKPLSSCMLVHFLNLDLNNSLSVSGT